MEVCLQPGRLRSSAFSGDPLAGLVGLVASGDEEALGRLYDATRRKVYGLVLRIVREPEAAEEVVLEVYTQVWRRAATYDPDRGSVAGWLLTLARTRAIDALRARARQTDRSVSLRNAGEVPDPGPDPEEASVGAERAGRVRRAVCLLPREQRQAIEVAYFGGLSHTEVAETLGMPLGTVKTRIRTGLSALRRALVASEEGLA